MTLLTYKTIITVIIGCRTSSVLLEVLVLVCTWIKTFKELREMRRLGFPLTLTRCMLRDGEITYLQFSLPSDLRLIGTMYFGRVILCT